MASETWWSKKCNTFRTGTQDHFALEHVALTGTPVTSSAMFTWGRSTFLNFLDLEALKEGMPTKAGTMTSALLEVKINPDGWEPRERLYKGMWISEVADIITDHSGNTTADCTGRAFWGSEWGVGMAMCIAVVQIFPEIEGMSAICAWAAPVTECGFIAIVDWLKSTTADEKVVTGGGSAASWARWLMLCLGLVTSRSSYTGSVFEVISGRIRIESVVQVIFDV